MKILKSIFFGVALLSLAACGSNNASYAIYESEDGEAINQYFQSKKSGNSIRIDSVLTGEHNSDVIDFKIVKDRLITGNDVTIGYIYRISLSTDLNKTKADDSLNYLSFFSLQFNMANEASIANDPAPEGHIYNRWYGMGPHSKLQLETVTFVNNKVENISFREGLDDADGREDAIRAYTYLLDAFSEFMARENLPLTMFK